MPAFQDIGVLLAFDIPDIYITSRTTSRRYKRLANRSQYHGRVADVFVFKSSCILAGADLPQPNRMVHAGSNHHLAVPAKYHGTNAARVPTEGCNPLA